MGGIFATVYAALEQTDAVRNVAMLGAPIDLRAARIPARVDSGRGQAARRPCRDVRLLPVCVVQTLFNLTQPAKTITRPLNLLWNLWDDEYLESYEAMNKWTSDFLHYPQAAFTQFATDFVRDNKLVKNEIEMFGRRVDLGAIRSSYLVLASPNDQFGRPSAARPILDKIASEDKTVHARARRTPRRNGGKRRALQLGARRELARRALERRCGRWLGRRGRVLTEANLAGTAALEPTSGPSEPVEALLGLALAPLAILYGIIVGLLRFVRSARPLIDRRPRFTVTRSPLRNVAAFAARIEAEDVPTRRGFGAMDFELSYARDFVPSSLDAYPKLANTYFSCSPPFRRVELTSLDGVPIAAEIAEHDEGERPGVVVVHGTFGSSGQEIYATPAMQAFEDWGFNVAVVDRAAGDEAPRCRRRR